MEVLYLCLKKAPSSNSVEPSKRQEILNYIAGFDACVPFAVTDTLLQTLQRSEIIERLSSQMGEVGIEYSPENIEVFMKAIEECPDGVLHTSCDVGGIHGKIYYANYFMPRLEHTKREKPLPYSLIPLHKSHIPHPLSSQRRFFGTADPKWPICDAEEDSYLE